jgi:hypothetical protein
MFYKHLSIYKIILPAKRPFQWRILVILVLIYVLGNLASIPLLRKTNAPIEPAWQWGVITIIVALVIALSLLMANRTGLGAPLLEARLPRHEFSQWLRSCLALTAILLVVGMPFSLLSNLRVDSATYPFGWELLLASFRAGAVEEILSRLFMVSLFVWVGGFIKHDVDNQPTRGIYWLAIILAGLIFGWAHVDAGLGNPGVSFWDYALVMMLSTGVGIYFGWLFWQLGLEAAMFAHFAYDAFVSMVLVPVYLLRNPIAWLLLLTAMTIIGVLSFLFLVKRYPNKELT